MPMPRPGPFDGHRVDSWMVGPDVRLCRRPGADAGGFGARPGGAWIENGRIYVSGGSEFLARRVTDHLRRLARQRLTALVAEKAREAGLSPKSVRVKDTKSRWGSCAPDGTLAFCWRLILAPEFVQDYVVGHEVAHLRHMNHGRNFWALTEKLTAHRSAATAWLSGNGQALLRIG